MCDVIYSWIFSIFTCIIYDYLFSGFCTFNNSLYLSSITVPTISWKEKVLSTILMWRVSEPNLLKNNNKCLLIVIDLRNLAVLHGATYNFKSLKKMCIIFFCQAFRPAKLFAQKWKEAYTHYLFTLEVTGYPIYVLHIYIVLSC